MVKISIALVVAVLAVQVLGSVPLAQQILDAHNSYRQKYGVPDLTLSSEISAYAQEWANKLAADDKLAIRPKSKFGQNLYWASGTISDGSAPIASWTKGKQFYDYSKPEFSTKIGSFTQVVWRATTKLGVGIAESATGGSYVVANYDPAGNVQGLFAKNVLAPVIE